MPTSPDKVLLQAAIDLDVAALKRTLKRGANPNAADRKGQTALMLLGQRVMVPYQAGQIPYVRSLALQEQVEQSVEALLQAGGSADATDQAGCTVLHNPIYHAFAPGALRMLLQHQAPVNRAAEYGATPAHVCAAHGCIGSLQALSEAGVDWSARAPAFGNLPIHVAAASGNALALRYLVGAGYSLREPNASGEDAVQMALEARRDLENVARVLLEQNTAPTMQELRDADIGLWTSSPHRLAAFIDLYLAARQSAPSRAYDDGREWILGVVAKAIEADVPLEWGGAPEALARLMHDCSPLGTSPAAYDLMAAVLKRTTWVESQFAIDLEVQIVRAHPEWSAEQIQTLLKMTGDPQGPQAQDKAAPLLALQQAAELEALQDLDAARP